MPLSAVASAAAYIRSHAAVAAVVVCRSGHKFEIRVSQRRQRANTTNEMENIRVKKCTFFMFACFCSHSGEIWALISRSQAIRSARACARDNHPTDRQKKDTNISMAAKSDENETKRKKKKRKKQSRAHLSSRQPTKNRFNNLSFLCSLSFSLFFLSSIYLQMVFVRQQWPPHLWLKYSNYTKYYNLCVCFVFFFFLFALSSVFSKNFHFRFMCACTLMWHRTDAESQAQRQSHTIICGKSEIAK